jgi:hypothetical protein
VKKPSRRRREARHRWSGEQDRGRSEIWTEHPRGMSFVGDTGRSAPTPARRRARRGPRVVAAAKSPSEAGCDRYPLSVYGPREL